MTRRLEQRSWWWFWRTTTKRLVRRLILMVRYDVFRLSLQSNTHSPWWRRAFMTLTELQAGGMSESIQLVSWATPAPDFRWPSNRSKPQFFTFCHMANSNFQVTESLRIWVYTTPGRQLSLSHYLFCNFWQQASFSPPAKYKLQVEPHSVSLTPTLTLQAATLAPPGVWGLFTNPVTNWSD